MNVSADTTSVPCSGWNPNGQNCSFEVQTISEDCELISDPVNETMSLRGRFSYMIMHVIIFHI